MLQTKILLFGHAQVVVHHIQENLTGILFLEKKCRVGKILKQMNWWLKIFIAGKKELQHSERFYVHTYKKRFNTFPEATWCLWEVGLRKMT